MVIAGNHDLTLDAEMVRDERQYLDRQFSIRKAVCMFSWINGWFP